MKTKRGLKIFTIIVAVLIVWLFVRFVVGGPEDDWICVDGEWIEHGVPNAPMPTEPCN